MWAKMRGKAEMREQVTLRQHYPFALAGALATASTGPPAAIGHIGPNSLWHNNGGGGIRTHESLRTPVFKFVPSFCVWLRLVASSCGTRVFGPARCQGVASGCVQLRRPLAKRWQEAPSLAGSRQHQRQPSANSTPTMITLTKPIERKGWLAGMYRKDARSAAETVRGRFSRCEAAP